MERVGIAAIPAVAQPAIAESESDRSLRAAANEFEALFVRQLLKSMRDAIPDSGLLDGPGRQTFESMLDDQWSRQIAGQDGGLGDMLARHLQRYMNESSEKPIRLDPAPGINLTQQGAGGGELQVGIDPRISMNSLPGALQQAMAVESALGDDRAGSTGQREFVMSLWPHARLAESATGVPAAYIIGQAALESGWGRGEIRHPDGRTAFNLFGIKAGSNWRGDTVDVLTNEYIDGQMQRRRERFRSYNSYAEAFGDWVGLMKGLPRYASVLNQPATAEQFAQGLQRAGYATDPNYSEKLSRIIRQTIAIRQRDDS